MLNIYRRGMHGYVYNCSFIILGFGQHPALFIVTFTLKMGEVTFVGCKDVFCSDSLKWERPNSTTTNTCTCMSVWACQKWPLVLTTYKASQYTAKNTYEYIMQVTSFKWQQCTCTCLLWVHVSLCAHVCVCVSVSVSVSVCVCVRMYKMPGTKQYLTVLSFFREELGH